jgi:hypothetical protein
MRGSDAASGALFSYVDMEARVPATHPLRTIRTIVNEVLTALDTSASGDDRGRVTRVAGSAGAGRGRLCTSRRAR